MVARALPACWDVVAPETLCRVRAIAAADALSEVCRTEARSELVAALPLLRRAVAACGGDGRVMAGANRSLWPIIAPALGTAGLGEAWQACTTLREHRGDGHTAALVANGLSGLESHLLAAATKAIPAARAAGEPRLERGGVGGRPRGAQGPWPRPRRRAGQRHRAHPARGGGGSHRPPGRARLRRAQRRGTRAPPRCPVGLRDRHRRRPACCPSPTRWGCRAPGRASS